MDRQRLLIPDGPDIDEDLLGVVTRQTPNQRGWGAGWAGISGAANPFSSRAARESWEAGRIDGEECYARYVEMLAEKSGQDVRRMVS